MYRAPLSDIPKYPLTSGIAVMAIVLTLLMGSGYDVRGLMFLPHAFFGEPWRMVTWILPHGGVLHLVFNVYWLWVFGAFLEELFGPFKTVVLIVATAVVSGFLQFVMVGPNFIGLSGIIYAMFGFFVVAKRVNIAYARTIDSATEQVLGAWFFIAIVLDQLGQMSIANWVHGGGFVVGAFFGLAWAGRKSQRVIGYAVLSVLVAIPTAFLVLRYYPSFTLG